MGWLDSIFGPADDEYEFREAVTKELKAIRNDLRILRGISPEEMEVIMVDVRQRFETMKKEITDTRKEVDGAVLLMDGMSMVIQDLKEKLNQGTLTEDDFAAVETELRDQRQDMKDAIVRNTPSEQNV